MPSNPRLFDSGTGKRRSRRGRLVLVLLLLVAAAVSAVGAFRAGPAPSVEILPGLAAVGRATPISVVSLEPKRGVSRLRIEAIQESTSVVVAETTAPPSSPLSWSLGGGTASLSVKAAVGSQSMPALRAGELLIRATATGSGSWLRSAPVTVVEKKLPVRLAPPKLEVVSTHTYVAPGGSEAVVYRVGETTARDGVQVGDRFFPGFPLAGGGAGDRFALFALPHDATSSAGVTLLAVDDAGNERRQTFVDQFMPRPMKSDTIELTDSFLEKVVPEIRGETPGLADKGDLLQNFLEINGDLRRKNNAELVDLAAKSAREFLWKEPFLPFPNGKVMSSFADRRTYHFKGQVVDHQDHLGFDLASVRGAPVPAANRGRVVLARYFGIYGNAVVLDHGYGLMSLYAHLSAIDVKEGDTVERGGPLGKTGATGLAGGDHLHFTFVLGGLPVNPIEWWDPHWVRDRLKEKLGAALPFTGEGVPVSTIRIVRSPKPASRPAKAAKPKSSHRRPPP